MTTQTRKANEIRLRVDQLSNLWRGRNTKMKEWYNLIRLDNHLAQQGMESVISPDPRTSFNMASWLLTPKVWSFEFDKSSLSEDEARVASQVEGGLNKEFMRIERSRRSGLFGSFLHQVMRNFLSTGWVSFITWPGEPWRYQAWNPATVFPEYDDRGNMIECGRKYSISPRQANLKIATEGWIPPVKPFTSVQVVRNLWVFAGDEWWMGASIGDHTARELSPVGTPFQPIYCVPGGGLPDDGSLNDTSWRAEIGQAVVAVVLDFQKNYDKMLTYMQQLLKDTANPKYIERLHGAGVLTPENIYARGSIYTIEPGEDIYTLSGDSPPVDLRGHSLDLKSQLGRAQFPDISFGNFTQQVSAFLMSNATAATQQVLDPFRTTLQGTLGDSAADNLRLMALQDRAFNGVRGMAIPVDVPLDFVYSIDIPGDFINRANSARLVSPDWRMSSDTTTRVLFPEIQNPALEASKVATELAIAHPLFRTVQTISELRQGAFQASSVGDTVTRDLLNAAADRLEGEVIGQPTPEAGAIPQSTEGFNNLVRNLS